MIWWVNKWQKPTSAYFLIKYSCDCADLMRCL
jgi:hypothetical protein